MLGLWRPFQGLTRLEHFHPNLTGNEFYFLAVTVVHEKLCVPRRLVFLPAAFDFLAGVKPQAPSWMRRSGLEWLFRLCTEPRRLWKRYLVTNTIFLRKLAGQFFRQRVLRLPVAAPRDARGEGTS